MTRLKEREDCHLRLAFKEVEGPTYKKIVEERKREMLENNVKVFGKVSIGVHGVELPKFSDEPDLKEWWKQKQGFTKDPKYKSASHLKQDKKYWAKADQMLLADHLEEYGPVDPFKQTHIAVHKKTQIVEKINQITHLAPTEDVHDEANQTRKTHNYKWSTIENQFTRKKNRLFDELPPAKVTRADQEPLFSSFHPKGIFNPPVAPLVNELSPQADKPSRPTTQTLGRRNTQGQTGDGRVDLTSDAGNNGVNQAKLLLGI